MTVWLINRDNIEFEVWAMCGDFRIKRQYADTLIKADELATAMATEFKASSIELKRSTINDHIRG